MKKVLAAVALMGVAVGAQAATATLTGVTTYNKNGTLTANLKSSTATWDLTGGTATQTGGTLIAKFAPFYNHTMVGGVIGAGAATATDWKCIEGSFGSGVGAHLCGNYSFGADFKVGPPVTGNDSTYTATATGGFVTLNNNETGLIPNDDFSIGAAQTLANSYSGLTLTSLGGGNYRLGNGVAGVGGYDFFFSVAVVPVPAAVWLFGSALGLMGAMRRRAAV